MQTMKRSVLVLLLSIVWIRCSYSAEEVTGWALSDTPVVVQGGTLIDVRNGDLIRDAVIVIKGDRIESVNSTEPLPQDAIVLDATGKFIIPGLIDAHVHYKNFSGPLYLNHGVEAAAAPAVVS